MTTRLIGALLCGVGFLCSAIVFAQAAKIGENNSPIPRDRKAQTTVKSDKSNTSDRTTAKRNGIGIYIVGPATKQQSGSGKTGSSKGISQPGERPSAVSYQLAASQSSSTFTISLTSQSLSVTPAAIAGMTRSVLWMRTKL